MPNRYYLKIHKTWYIPIEKYEMFYKEISNQAEFNIEVREYKPGVLLKINDDKLEIKFSEFIEDIKRFLEFPGSKYYRKQKKITMAKEELDKIISLTNELNYAIFYQC